MLFKIYKKEMIDSLRDRRTLLLTVFLPILMMTALTLFYESMIASGEDETFTLAVESSLTENQKLIVGSLENVELLEKEDPETTFLDGDAHAALLFAEDFDEQVQNGGVGNVDIIGDTVSQNSANLMFLVNNQLNEYERIVAGERLEAANVDPAITEAIMIKELEMNAEDSNIMLLALLIPLILGVAIGAGAGPAAADLFAGEKERKTMEALLMTPVNRSTLLFAKFLTITSVGMMIGLITLLVIFVEIAFFTEHLKAAVNLGDQLIPVLAIGLLVILIYASLVGSVLMITSIIGKTVKEAQSYAAPILMVAVMPLLFITGLSVQEYTITHYLLPFVNVYPIMTELLLGIIDWNHITMMLGSNIASIMMILLVSRVLFRKDKWMIN